MITNGGQIGAVNDPLASALAKLYEALLSFPAGYADEQTPALYGVIGPGIGYDPSAALAETLKLLNQVLALLKLSTPGLPPVTPPVPQAQSVVGLITGLIFLAQALDENFNHGGSAPQPFLDQAGPPIDAAPPVRGVFADLFEKMRVSAQVLVSAGYMMMRHNADAASPLLRGMPGVLNSATIPGIPQNVPLTIPDKATIGAAPTTIIIAAAGIPVVALLGIWIFSEIKGRAFGAVLDSLWKGIKSSVKK